MRTKYATTALVLARYPLGEASLSVVLLTPDLGLLRARAQSVRKPGAKLAAALATLAQSDVQLVRGREGWRLSGAALAHNWYLELPKRARSRAQRIGGLILRLVQGAAPDPALFETYASFLASLAELSDDEADAAECLAALRILHCLGLDAGALPGTGGYDTTTLGEIARERTVLVARINRGIAASGL